MAYLLYAMVIVFIILFALNVAYILLGEIENAIDEE